MSFNVPGRGLVSGEEYEEWRRMPRAISWTEEHMRKQRARIERLELLLKQCKFRLFGAGPSTDPLYAEIRDALTEKETK